MTQEVIDRLLVPIQSNVYHGPTGVFIFWCQSGSPKWPWKTLNFQACFQMGKTQKTCSQGLQKTRKSTLESPITDFCESIFLQYLPCENLVLRAPTDNNPTHNPMQKMTWKHAPKKQTEFNPSELKKGSQNGLPKSFKIGKIWFWAPMCPSVVPLNFPKLTKRSPGWKMKAPGM